MRTRLALCLLLTCLGCGKKEASSEQNKEETAKPEVATPVGGTAQNQADSAAANGALELLVDGKVVQTTKFETTQRVLEIESLPPIEKWKSIAVIAKDGRAFHGFLPMNLTGDKTMQLVPREGRIDFEVVEVSGVVTHKMHNLAKLSITTVDYVPAKSAPVLTLTYPGGEVPLVETLDDIPRTPEPGKETARDTWKMSDVLKANQRSEHPFLVLKGKTGTLDLSSQSLADPNTMHMLKRSKQGQHHYRSFDVATGQRKAELRDLVEIAERGEDTFEDSE